jgi:tRNA (guanine37-N1)-methyltransferase
MRIDVVTLFPEMVRSLAAYGVVGRAIRGGTLDFAVMDLRDCCHDAHRTADDRPYGGGPGMVLKYEPVVEALRALRDRTPDTRVIYLSPQGPRFDQAAARRIAGLPAVTLLAGRYEGIDERIVDAEIDEELSIGDFVLSGGELAAMVVADCVARLLPGVLGHDESAELDSFSDGLLDCPHYTRPPEIEGRAVPDVLMGGDHAAIARWRRKQALGRTWLRRRELIEARVLSPEDQRLLDEFIAETNVSARQ